VSDTARRHDERDRLLEQIRLLDEEHRAGEVDEADYRHLRDGYVARAAAVIRQLESDPAPEPPPASDGSAAPSAPAATGAPPVGDPATPSAPAGDGQPAGPLDAAAPDPAPGAVAGGRRRRIRTVVGTAGAVVFAVGAGLLVASALGSRQPGQSSSGSVPPTPAQELASARQAMAAGDDLDAVKLYNAVLAVEPDQPEALAYRGWLLRLTGDARKDPTLVAEGLDSVKAAVAADPQYPDARFFLGVILLDEEHDPAGAVPQLEAYLASRPGPQVIRAVQPILERARQEAAARS